MFSSGSQVSKILFQCLGVSVVGRTVICLNELLLLMFAAEVSILNIYRR